MGQACRDFKVLYDVSSFEYSRANKTYTKPLRGVRKCARGNPRETDRKMHGAPREKRTPKDTDAPRGNEKTENQRKSDKERNKIWWGHLSHSWFPTPPQPRSISPQPFSYTDNTFLLNCSTFHKFYFQSNSYFNSSPHIIKRSISP